MFAGLLLLTSADFLHSSILSYPIVRLELLESAYLRLAYARYGNLGLDLSQTIGIQWQLDWQLSSTVELTQSLMKTSQPIHLGAPCVPLHA